MRHLPALLALGSAVFLVLALCAWVVVLIL